MKNRLDRALAGYPIADWSIAIHDKKANLLSRVNEWPAWTRAAFKWDPSLNQHLNAVQPYRCVGRPLSRWNDGVTPVPVRTSYRAPYVSKHNEACVPFFLVPNDNWW